MTKKLNNWQESYYRMLLNRIVEDGYRGCALCEVRRAEVWWHVLAGTNLQQDPGAQWLHVLDGTNPEVDESEVHRAVV